MSHVEVKNLVDGADLILAVGALLSDFNTGSFSYSYKTKNVIEFHADCIKIKQGTYPGVQMKEVLNVLIDKIDPAVKHYNPIAIPSPTFLTNSVSPTRTCCRRASLTQEWLWSKVSAWFREGDIIITETGTSAFGIVQTKFPNNTIGISQVLWGSVGFTVGATLGAVMAAEEIDPNKRVILFVGDGSLQLTVQEISTMVKWETRPYLFVLNNDGYTIDRLIHGMSATYNDIQPWNNLALLPLFNAKYYDAIQVSTTDELEKLFCDEEFAINSKIRMIEVMLPRMDAPINLIKQMEFISKMNADT